MKLRLNGGNIEYDIHGPRNGIPVVFIHGFPFSREMWRYQVDALKNDYHVITYDVRGHGGSDPGDGQYSLELFVDDLIALLDHLKLQSAVAVGLSMGGYIVLRAIERHPERFRGIVLCDTRSEADGNEGKVKRARQVINLGKDGPDGFTASFLEAVFHSKTMADKPDVVDGIRTTMKNTPVEVLRGTLLALAGRTDTTPSLFRITVPALILVGRHDAVTPPSAAHAMKDKIPGAELHEIPEAGHLSNLENPEEFTTHLFNFLHRIKRIKP
jgi:3-oxoadipate enol-lactonase